MRLLSCYWKKKSFVFQRSVCSNFRKFESYIFCVNELDVGFNLSVLTFFGLKLRLLSSRNSNTLCREANSKWYTNLENRTGVGTIHHKKSVLLELLYTA
jgi:hypothetical protein